MARRHKWKGKCAPANDGSKPYSVYWSIYTDLPGRVAFRRLYWERLKDAIGRPTKLVGIEREELWPSGLPSHELRCHVWRFFGATGDAEAVADTLQAAMAVAPAWRILSSASKLNEEHLLEMIWDRDPEGADTAAAQQFSRLTSILVSVRRDTGFRVRPGYTIEGGGENERPQPVALQSMPQRSGLLVANWHMQVQTSTKRELLDAHWPLLQRRFGAGAEIVDLEKRSRDVGPFRFDVRQTIETVSKPAGIVAALRQASGLKVSSESRGEHFFMRGVGGAPSQGEAHCLIGFEARWTPN